MKSTFRFVNSYGTDSEYLQLSAGLMQNFATNNCMSSKWKEVNMDCSWYHSSWQYLRLLRLIPSPELHTEFYHQVFNVAPDTEYSVLISGTADYAIVFHLFMSMPHHLLRRTHFTIIDACNSPLMICKWFVEHFENKSGLNISVDYHLGDAFVSSFKDTSFDLITTYSFLSRFRPSCRCDLIREWHRILKPHGYIVTSDRIAKEYSVSPFKATKSQTSEFVARATDISRLRMHGLEDQIDMIRTLALGYAENIEEYSFSTINNFIELFSLFKVTVDAGLTPGELEFPNLYSWVMAEKI